MELAPPFGPIGWIAVGLIAGWLTGRIMRGRGYGCLTNLLLGVTGAVIGGFVVGFFVKGTAGFIGSIIVATIGAVLFVAVVRAVAGNRTAV
jgi:uncharacterized membrane protein YeaQ/YmgE (transglycosylase-associated protein family)